MKKLAFLLLWVSLFQSLLLMAGKEMYTVYSIPDSLLKNANSVVRLYQVEVEFKNPGALYRFHRVVTVLNENGAHELYLSLHYNQFIKIESFDAVLYDQDGRQMNRRFDDAFRDYALYDGFSLFSDARAKSVQTSGGSYPVTIDYSYVVQYSGLIDVPDWHIQWPRQSVEEASFKVTAGEDGIRYKCVNISLTPQIIYQHNSKNIPQVYQWNVSGLKALDVPVESYDDYYFLPHVDITPLRFEIAGHSGSWESWNTFGRAMYEMWKDKRDLPPDVVAKIKDMVKGANSDRQKAAILYNYLQQNFRYVGIQIGIGGYIPFSASTVHTTRYGDCKALSNYMCALLNVVGIKSYPALINAGWDEHEIDTSFASNYFNHAILYANLNDGPLWLECTSNSTPFGELGSFTENRYALIFDENGGQIIKTPNAGADANSLEVWNRVNIKGMEDEISSMANLKGEYQSEAKNELIRGTEKKRAAYVFSGMGFKQPDKYELKANDTSGAVTFTVTGSSKDLYDFKTGAKTFYPSTLISAWYDKITSDSTLGNDLVTEFAYHKTEHLLYTFPASRELILPANFAMDNELVAFSRKCEKLPDSQVAITTDLSVKKRIIHPTQIALLKQSLHTVHKYLQQKLITEEK